MAITNIETLSESFVDYLEKNDIATFGQDLFIDEVPNSKNTQKSLYWILTSGGNPISKLGTGEMIRLYAINIYYRSASGQDVGKKLHRLNELLSKPGCVQLEEFEIHDISVSQYPTTDDLDAEDRKVGFIRVNIQIYKRSA